MTAAIFTLRAKIVRLALAVDELLVVSTAGRMGSSMVI